MPLEENCQSSTLMELSNRARSNFKILQLGGHIFFNGYFIEDNLLMEKASENLREYLKNIFSRFLAYLKELLFLIILQI